MNTDPKLSSAERTRQEEVARQQRVAYKQRPRSRAGVILLGLLLFFVVGVGAAVFLLRQAGTGNSAAAKLASLLLSGRTTFYTSAPDVVNQIQRLNRLETVSYSVDTVVEGKHTNAVLPDLLFGDRLLLVVHGQVIAGVDMSKLKPESVHVDGHAITVDLPASEVFTTRIDSGKTRVFARTTGLLTPADPNLESDTRKTAETPGVHRCPSALNTCTVLSVRRPERSEGPAFARSSADPEESRSFGSATLCSG